MATELRIKAVVLPGGKIEITAPELIPGRYATVIVIIEDDEASEQHHVSDNLRELRGHQLLQNAQKVDAYLQEERDSWER